MSSLSKIDMLTRVEGHGSVELVRDGERVVGARMNLYESPRLFEALLVGRRFDEIADIACRICSICSTVHKVAALQAVEQALGGLLYRTRPACCVNWRYRGGRSKAMPCTYSAWRCLIISG